MAVISKPVSASLKLNDDNEKLAASYHRVNPESDPDNFVLFAEAVDTLRGAASGSMYLTVTAELEEI